nr:cytochrome P450 [Tanacetum cinerariifolium]
MEDFPSLGSKEKDNGWTWVIEKKNHHLRGNKQPTIGNHSNQNITSPNTITFYFTNFPLKWDHLIMKDIFAKYGKVEDVYIAKKWNIQGKRFGFARFLEVTNPIAFEQRLNTICIGTQKVQCYWIMLVGLARTRLE